ncbi:MAG: hypothetical protein KDA85_09200, partial [Planctomycetaceae bacterium]|nr:hypothetical protein [Planctomycetaceae bacterium]
AEVCLPNIIKTPIDRLINRRFLLRGCLTRQSGEAVLPEQPLHLSNLISSYQSVNPDRAE